MNQAKTRVGSTLLRERGGEGFFTKKTGSVFLKSLLFAACLLATVTLAVYYCPVPEKAIPYAGLFCAFASSFFGGRIAKRAFPKAPIPASLLNGCLLLLLMMALSLFVTKKGSGYSLWLSLLLHSLFLLFSVLGALGRDKKRRKTPKKRKAKR